MKISEKFRDLTFEFDTTLNELLIHDGEVSRTGDRNDIVTLAEFMADIRKRVI